MRNRLGDGDVHGVVAAVQPLRRHPRRSASRQLHRVRGAKASRAGINLLDYGCIRIFPPSFVGGVVDLYHGLLHGDDDPHRRTPTRPGASSASTANSSTCSTSGRASSTGRCSTTACAPSPTASKPSEYGRREAFRVHQALKQKGPVTVPREFVFMDRAAIGLGGVFLHLRAELNFYRLFNEAIEGFSVAQVADRQGKGIGQGEPGQ